MRLSFGRYETLSPIAAGGMASVHLGRALGAGGFTRLVAVKVMHPDIAGDPSFVAMFLDEGRLAAQIRHPNVVATLDVLESASGLALVMEYVEGPSLAAITRALWKKTQAVPLAIALRVVIDALLGLHAAHEQAAPDGKPLGIVHRDVSPHNILVGVDGQTKITDFGVALAEARLASTKSGHVKGKIGYMPPQQLRGGRLDRRADVYAAGVVLWELCTGERLFRGDNEGAVLFAALTGADRSPREVDPGVPEPIDRAVMRALSFEPDERWPTALAFADALEAAAAEAGVGVATHRAVATFVRELAIHKAPVIPADLPAPPAVITPIAEVAAAPVAEVRSAPSEGHSRVASVVAAPPQGARRSRAGVALAALGVAATLAAIAASSRTGSTAAPSSSVALSAAALSASAPPASIPSEAPSPVAPATTPPPIASAAPSAAPPRRGGPARPAAPTKPRPSHGESDWRPNKL